MGTAERVAPALRELIAAKTPEEANRAYWNLENVVVVQGGVYTSAEPTVEVLVKALADERPTFIRREIYTLLMEIIRGYPAEGVRVNEFELIHRCRATCQDAVWLLVRDALRDRECGALEILAVLSGIDPPYDGSPPVRLG
jgi:hypothetical protein